MKLCQIKIGMLVKHRGILDRRENKDGKVGHVVSIGMNTTDEVVAVVKFPRYQSESLIKQIHPANLEPLSESDC